MDSIFFGKPFKILILSMLIGSIGLMEIGISDQTETDTDRSRLSMNLSSGGGQLFEEISAGMIQITTSSGASGSGYMIDNQGHAITNAHVVAGSRDVQVAFFGDEHNKVRYRGELVNIDETIDLAVIKVDTDISRIHPLKFGDSDKVKMGDIVAACGSPARDNIREATRGITDTLEFFTFTLGNVIEILDFQHSWSTACFNNRYYASGVQYMFHISASVNPGNSGGPCVNDYGEVIGSNTWKFPDTKGGFSVPSNLLERSAGDIIRHGRTMIPWCGILLHPADSPTSRQIIETPVSILNYLWFEPEPERLEIHHVNPNSPAGKAGLLKGDIVVSVDNQRFSNVFDFYAYILGAQVGQDITFRITRNRMEMPPSTFKLSEKRRRRDPDNPFRTTLTY